MAAKPPPPIEISNALAAFDILRTEKPDGDYTALTKALPPLAQRLAHNNQDASIETLRTHAEQGVDHVRDLYQSLNAPQKNSVQKTYAEIVAGFPISIDGQFIQCVENGDIEQLRSFIESGFDIHADDDGALTSAAENGYTDIVKLLIEHDADVNTLTGFALRMAAANGHIDIVKLLIKNGAYINTHSHTPLQWAAEKGQIDVVRLLIKHGASIHSNNELALCRAASNGYIDLVHLFIQHNANIHESDDEALRWAAACGHIDIVKFLIKNGADIHAKNDESLRVAAENGHIDIVKILIKHKADIHADDDDALRRTTRNGHIDIVKLLMKHVTFTPDSIDEALQEAAANGHIDIVREMVEKHKADVHALLDYAIRHAAGNGHTEVVKFLIQHGADIHACDDEPLRKAATQGHFDVVNLLVQHKANIHAKDNAALIHAACHGHMSIVKLLLKHGADIHAQDEKALKLAVTSGHDDMVRILLHHGADVGRLSDEERKSMRWHDIHGISPPCLREYDPTAIKRSTLESLYEIFAQEVRTQDAWIYTYNTAALFGSMGRVLKYLEKWGAHGKQPLHDVIQMISIPSRDQIKNHQNPDLKAWGDAVLQCGPEMPKFVKFSYRLPRPAQDLSGRFWSLKNTKALIADFAYDNAHKNPQLSAMALDCAWDDDDFNTALSTIKKYQKKYATNDNKKPIEAVPDITIDGGIFGKDGFTFRRLPDGDMRGLALGAFTACCQHIGGEGRECVKHGFLSPKAAFYVVTNNKTDQIVAQSWAWRGTKDELVLDSLEYLPSQMNAGQWKTLCTAFAQAAQKSGIEKIHVGTGGNTPGNMRFSVAGKPATPADYNGYRDSEQQFIIAG